MNSIADEEREAFGGFGPNLNAMDFVPCFEVVVNSETIGVGIPKSLYSLLKVANMLFGPFDFGPNA